MARHLGAGLVQQLLRSSAPVVPLPSLQRVITRSFNPYESTNGPSPCQVDVAEEWYLRQRNSITLGNRFPSLPGDIWMAPNAVVVGDVDFHNKCSIWFGAVIRGDLNKIRVGYRSSIGDRAVLHAARSSPTGLTASCMVGYNCLIEPQSILRSARVGDGCIVGARSVLCEGSMMEDGSILAPGSVLPPGRRVPKGELWAGSPARFVRKLSGHEQEEVPRLAELMSVLAYDFFREVLPNGTQWRKIEAWRKHVTDSGEATWVDFRAAKYQMRLEHEAQLMEKMTS